MRTFSVLSIRTMVANEKLLKFRHFLSVLLACSFFLVVPFQFALLEWIPTDKGTWIILQGKIDESWSLIGSLVLSFTQLIGCTLFLCVGFIVRFAYERTRHYLSSETYSITYYLAWVQTLSLFTSVFASWSTAQWMIQIFPYFAHLWMVIVGVCMFYLHRLGDLWTTLQRIKFWKATLVCLFLYICVYSFLDAWITRPFAEWFSIELSSWREQSINQTLKSASHSGSWSLFVQWLFVGCIGPIAEEIFFRGLLQRAITKQWGVMAGIVLSAMLFALFHVDIPLFAPLFVLGLILAWLRHYFTYLWVPIAFHMLNNSMSVLLDILTNSRISS